MRAPSAGASADYWTLSSRPLYALALLSPLVLLYELGSALYLTNSGEGVRQTIRAQRLLGEFFEATGIVGLFMPGIALVAVLLAWHVLRRDPWRLRPAVLAGMAVEAAAWVLPLLVLGGVLGRSIVALAAPDPLSELGWQARATISIGAGLYEELLFRLVGLALLHFVLSDLAGMRDGLARALALAGSAIAFALYHDASFTATGANWSALGFYLAAGLFFGTLYLLRGFGIVVAAHAFYDLFVLVIFPALR